MLPEPAQDEEWIRKVVEGDCEWYGYYYDTNFPDPELEAEKGVRESVDVPVVDGYGPEEPEDKDDNSDAESDDGYSSGGDTLSEDDDQPWISGETTPRETTPDVDEYSDKEFRWSDFTTSLDLSEAEGTWCNDESSLDQKW